MLFLSDGQARLVSIHEKIGDLKNDGSDVHLIHLYLTDLKSELSKLRNEVLVITVDASDPLMSNTQRQEDNIFDMSVKVKKLLFLNPSPESAAATPPITTAAVKLPKIDVPTFAALANILGAIQHISDTEKLVYLRHSLKDGSAKNVLLKASRTLVTKTRKPLTLSKLDMTAPGSSIKLMLGRSTKYQVLQTVQAKSSDGSTTP